MREGRETDGERVGKWERNWEKSRGEEDRDRHEDLKRGKGC